MGKEESNRIIDRYRGQTGSGGSKYGFDHHEAWTYEEVTAPLRQLLVKDATNRWDPAPALQRDVQGCAGEVGQTQEQGA